jgi:hypothetical protein
MNEGFSGQPVTRWIDDRVMRLVEEFWYVDPDGNKWVAPAESEINGATIPKALWSSLGSPYAGKYRRASIVHDVGVGELSNPDVTPQQRKAADRMFYHACRYDGCSRYLAKLLYTGVRLGTWASIFTSREVGLDVVRDSSEADFIRKKFWEVVDDEDAMIEDEADLDALDAVIDKHLGTG